MAIFPRRVFPCLAIEILEGTLEHFWYVSEFIAQDAIVPPFDDSTARAQDLLDYPSPTPVTSFEERFEDLELTVDGFK